MADDRATWIHQSFQLALVTAGFHLLQFLASASLWVITGSAALAVFGLAATAGSLLVSRWVFQRSLASYRSASS